MNKFAILFVLFLSTNSYAYTQDSGKITNMFVTPTGTLGFKVGGGKQGIPKAASEYQCTSGGGWIGNSDMDATMKSVIIAAKMAGNNVTVTIQDCNGTWFKLKDLYVN